MSMSFDITTGEPILESDMPFAPQTSPEYQLLHCHERQATVQLTTFEVSKSASAALPPDLASIDIEQFLHTHRKP